MNILNPDTLVESAELSSEELKAKIVRLEKEIQIQEGRYRTLRDRSEHQSKMLGAFRHLFGSFYIRS
jgi:hypothetical protein